MNAERTASARVTPRDLALLPNLLSMARVPLAAIFPLVKSPAQAGVVLALAGVSDVLDGWVARRRGQATATGAMVDPIADKIFSLSVVGTLIAGDRLPLWAAPALLSREILEAPLVARALARHARGVPFPVARANFPGKAATAAQFGVVLAALAAPRAVSAMLGVATAMGIAAGVAYWIRELQRSEPLPDVQR